MVHIKKICAPFFQVNSKVNCFRCGLLTYDFNYISDFVDGLLIIELCATTVLCF